MRKMHDIFPFFSLAELQDSQLKRIEKTRIKF